MKILMFLTSGFGDVLFAAPTVFALKEIYPEAKIIAAVPHLRFNRFLLENVLPFDDVILLKRLRSLSPVAAIRYVRDFIQLAATIRRHKFDIVIATVQARLVDQYLLMLLSRAKRRIGFKLWRRKKNWYSFVLTDKLEPAYDEHICNMHFEIARFLDKELKIDKYFDKVSQVLRESAKPVSLALETNRLVAILPGTGSQPYKRWDFKNFIEVIRYILDKYDCDVAVIGGQGEYDESLLPQAIVNNKRFHNIGRKLAADEVIELFLKTDLVFGNDSGLLHLAEFLDIPTIGIYATNWGHLSKRYLDGDTKHIVMPANQKDVALDYLLNHTWHSRKFKKLLSTVVNSILPEDVIKEIDNLLKNNPAN